MTTVEERLNSVRAFTTGKVKTRRANLPLLNIIRRLLLSDYFILYLTVAFFIVAAMQYETLKSYGNMANQLQNMLPLLTVAIGQTFVLIIGGIDLSVGATMGITSVVGAFIMAENLNPAFFDKTPLWGEKLPILGTTIFSEAGGLLHGDPLAVPVAVAAMLLVGMLIGFLNGFAITQFRLAPFMVTLVTSTFFAAFALWLTQSRNISGLPEDFIKLGKGDLISIYVGPKNEPQIPRRELLPFINYPFVIAIGLAIVSQLILSRTVFGKHMFSIGTNRRTSEISGVPSRRVTIAVYMFSGFCAAIASILYSARLEIGQPSLGSGRLLLDIIGAAVIGGTSLFGGKGSVRGTFFGIAFFVLLLNILNAMRLSPFIIDAVKGVIILIAALLDITRTRLINRETRV